MENVRFKYVDLVSLGTDETNWNKTNAEWALRKTKRGGTYIHIETIPKGIVGEIYYDILFYAFIY